MAEADPEALVLGGIIPDRLDRAALARVRLRPEQHFGNTNHRLIYAVVERLYDRYGSVVAADQFSHILRSRDEYDAVKVVVLEQLYEKLASSTVAESRFRWGLDELVERVVRKQTGDMIAESYEILLRGWEDIEHNPGVVQRGHEAAREHLVARLGEIERAAYGDDAPEGDMRHESDDALSDYAARKESQASGKKIGARSGVGVIDKTTGGVQPGELCLVAGYTTAGKSMCCTGWVWHMAVEEGADVMFFTTETIRTQVRRRLLARHSRKPEFGRPGGLNSKDIRMGTLSAGDEEVLRAVVDDLDKNPHYGAIQLAQLPHGAPMTYVDQRLRELGRKHEFKLCVIDYLTLLRAETKRDRAHEEYNDILRSAKQMATSFDNGNGIPVISPWQVQQKAYREAMERRAYTLTNLADTSEAEKISDLIIMLMREEDEFRSARIQFLKARDADIPPIQEVEIDFRNSYFADRSLGGYVPSTDGSSAATTGADEMDEFLNA
jgi:replicative DNA helicase